MGDYVRQRVTHMTSIIVPIFFSLQFEDSRKGLLKHSDLDFAQVWSPSLRFQLNKLYNYSRSRNHNNSRGFFLTKHEDVFLVIFANFFPIQLGASQSQIKGGSSTFVEIILHQEFSLYLLNLEVLGRPDMPSPMMSNSRASLNRIFISSFR